MIQKMKNFICTFIYLSIIFIELKVLLIVKRTIISYNIKKVEIKL